MIKYNISYMKQNGEIINTTISGTGPYDASNNFYKATGIWTTNVWPVEENEDA